MGNRTLYIGISGWAYPGWRGALYPSGLPQRRELEYASRQFNSIEINGTFYSLQRPESYQRWHGETPEGFRFAVKGARFVTHVKRLKDIRAPLANFFASGILCLKEKLGPVLWQLPPSLRFNEALLDDFFALLPTTTEEAAKLAAAHEERLAGRAWTRAEHDGPIRHALEVRNDSFRDNAYVEMLRRHGIASVVSEGAGRWPMMEEVTADFVYVRLHYTTRYWGAERRSVIIEELHQFLSGSRTLPDQSCDSESRAARSASSG